MEIDRGQVQVD